MEVLLQKQKARRNFSLSASNSLSVYPLCKVVDAPCGHESQVSWQRSCVCVCVFVFDFGCDLLLSYLCGLHNLLSCAEDRVPDLVHKDHHHQSEQLDLRWLRVHQCSWAIGHSSVDLSFSLVACNPWWQKEVPRITCSCSKESVPDSKRKAPTALQKASWHRWTSHRQVVSAGLRHFNNKDGIL